MASAATLAPPPVAKPAFLTDWDTTAFVNWSYDPDILRGHLPQGLELDLFDGKGWLSLVLFHAGNAHFPWSPPIRPLSNYQQFNLRTYVRGADGTPGVYFFSMDIDEPVVLLGRLTYGAPYMLASMTVARAGDELHYASARRWGGPGCSCDVRLRIGAPYDNGSVPPVAPFLADRWWLYAVMKGRLVRAAVAHQPWQLSEATVLSLRETIVEAAGIKPLPQPAAVFYAGSVSARIGSPEPV
jgi:uncharacterized protein YqjF (DUF2071 family)